MFHSLRWHSGGMGSTRQDDSIDIKNGEGVCHFKYSFSDGFFDSQEAEADRSLLENYSLRYNIQELAL